MEGRIVLKLSLKTVTLQYNNPPIRKTTFKQRILIHTDRNLFE